MGDLQRDSGLFGAGESWAPLHDEEEGAVFCFVLFCFVFFQVAGEPATEGADTQAGDMAEVLFASKPV